MSETKLNINSNKEHASFYRLHKRLKYKEELEKLEGKFTLFALTYYDTFINIICKETSFEANDIKIEKGPPISAKYIIDEEILKKYNKHYLGLEG